VLSQVGDYEIEIVVVDDGSTDDTQQVLKRYETVKYIYQENRGMNAARNRGIDEAAGEYVCLLDSDDAWLSFKAAVQIQLMENLPSVGFAFSNFYIWRNGNRVADGLNTWMLPGMSIDQHAVETISSKNLKISGLQQHFDILLCDVYKMSMYQPVVLPSTSIIRRAVLDELGPLPEDNWMCGDWEYFARASKKFQAAYMDVETALNRSHNDAVRLMRRDLADRTKLRLESIKRTWKSDVEFMARYENDVTRVECAEWETLCKLACYEKDLPHARIYLAKIDNLLGYVPGKLRLLYALMRVPGSIVAMDAIRRMLRGLQ
jgi:glycosyltransferase involved in cell wall biosynthesis